MKTFLQFLAERLGLPEKLPEGTVLHMQEIDHPSDRGRKAHMVVAYHPDASTDDTSYARSEIVKHAKDHPPGMGPQHGIGFAIFHKDPKGQVYRAHRLHTDYGWQRRGVATAMYDHAKSQGLTIKPSSDQSEKGKLFWKGYKKHLKAT